MPGINMMPSGSTLQIPLDACTGFSAKAGNAKVELTWTDPKDKYATPEGDISDTGDQLVSEWDHTVLVRKTGSQPAGPNDGTVAVSSSVRNQYQSTPYTDTGLTNDTTYYYAVFAYNKDGVASAGAFANATPIAGTPLGSLAEGTLIKILENGAPVEFYVAKQNYEEGLNGAGRVLCVRKDVYDQRQWNGSYMNTWGNSSIRSFLNGTYKNLFSSDTRSKMGSTTFYYTPGNNNNNVSTRSDSVFLLSITELDRTKDGVNVEGSPLPIANVFKFYYTDPRAVPVWTRSPDTEHYGNVGYVYYNDIEPNGDVGRTGATQTLYFWPCFTLPSTALVDQDLNLIES